MSIVDEFRKWCGKLGGEVKGDEYIKFYSCELPDYLKSEDVKDFISFVDAKKRDITKKQIDVCVGYTTKLIGGYKETERVCYFPIDDVIDVSVHYYSDYGLPGVVREGLPKAFKQRETIDSIRVVFEKERGAEFNDATDEWMDLGEVSASFSFRTAKKNPDVIAKTLEKAKDEARYLANEALEYIAPPEEEEESW